MSGFNVPTVQSEYKANRGRGSSYQMSLQNNFQNQPFRITLPQGQPTPASYMTLQPSQPAPQQPVINIRAPIQRDQINLFDSQQRALLVPNLNFSLADRAEMTLKHPANAATWRQKLPGFPAAGESHEARVQMALAIWDALPSEGREHFKSLVRENVLNDTATDDGHSTLYHLYSMLTTPRAATLNNAYLVNETVRLLNKPYLITQKFATLSENTARVMLQLKNNTPPNAMPINGLPMTQQPNMPMRRMTWQDIKVDNSATCVASSVMYYMADKSPGELSRHLNEVTSPLQAFYEKVKLAELAPDKPQEAFEILRQYGIPYRQIAHNELEVKVQLPTAGLLRAIDSSQQFYNRYHQAAVTGSSEDPGLKGQSGIEAAYQTALTYLGTRTYDPATDLRDSEIPGEGSKGLTEIEKTLMETIVKDNGGVASITYQVVAGKNNPSPEEEGLPYLYGYTRTYEQTTQDMIDALNMGEFVIAGITDTDETGAVIGGHEITITGAFVDPQDNELSYVVVDSDDDIPTPVVRDARELTPKIHHAGMPLALARRIQSQVDAVDGYYVPVVSDLNRFKPITFINEKLSPDAFGPPPQETSPQQQPGFPVQQRPSVLVPDYVQNAWSQQLIPA